MTPVAEVTPKVGFWLLLVKFSPRADQVGRRVKQAPLVASVGDLLRRSLLKKLRKRVKISCVG